MEAEISKVKAASRGKGLAHAPGAHAPSKLAPAALCDGDHALTGRQFWRSLEELAGDDEFAAALGHEFPEHADRLMDGPTRRQFLQVMGASLALAGAQGCVEQPHEKIVTYVRPPEQMVPGIPLYYATAMTHDGAGVGLLAESHMGRPTKIEGNPLHPSVPEIMKGANDAADDAQTRFGATDTFSQAAVLSLYDPDRSQTVLCGGQIDTWESFVAELGAHLKQLQPHDGRGLRILTQTIVSPTLADQIQQLLDKYPNARWHQYDPLRNDNAVLGSQMAFGADVGAIYHVERADVILSLNSDFLVEGPRCLMQARGFADRRRVNAESDTDSGAAKMNRLYAMETSPTLTGASADHRLPVAPPTVAAFAAEIAKTLGLDLSAAPAGGGADIPPEWLTAVVDDLQRSRGRSLVVVGRSQPPVVHALAHWINDALGNVGQTVEYREPNVARTESHLESLRNLVEAMRADEVHALMIVDGNPAYDAPSDLDFAAALEHVPLSAHLSQYVDETSALCAWHLPQAHLLESWSDTRAANGTASIVQPLIAPLFRGKTAHELLGVMLDNPAPASYDIVRSYWQRQSDLTGERSDFERFWKTALHNGVISGTASSAASVSIGGDFASAVAESIVAIDQTSAGKFSLVFRPGPTVWDGRFANSGWLQELPQPLTKITWDNAALVSPKTAAEQVLANGDVIDVAAGQSSVSLPVFVVPGHGDHTITLFLGYGRRRAGRVGNSVGTNIYPLRTTGAMWFATDATIRKTGRNHELAVTQHHHLMEGRHLIRAGTFAEYEADPAHPPFMAVGHEPPADDTIFPPIEYNGNKWGMVVNQSACTGCNACVVACQAENNIPVVGRDQVAIGREMHWIRIDQYYDGEPENPASYHQPVMCQHCEMAPCEPVCPVAATTHSDEGLNEMTYNRCVGTRYCSNNCPYKVRRFNFFDYNTELQSNPTLQLLSNPDVTVRSRGVMEKCTYCVQRINAARITAEKQDRPIRDGEIVTACQAACPTQAIVFGNLNDETSEVTRAAASSLNYSLLGELNTRPRTQYLAALRNPNPVLLEATTDGPAH